MVVGQISAMLMSYFWDTSDNFEETATIYIVLMVTYGRGESRSSYSDSVAFERRVATSSYTAKQVPAHAMISQQWNIVLALS